MSLALKRESTVFTRRNCNALLAAGPASFYAAQYELDKATGERAGCIDCMHVDAASGQLRLGAQYDVAQGGVFDIYNVESASSAVCGGATIVAACTDGSALFLMPADGAEGLKAVHRVGPALPTMMTSCCLDEGHLYSTHHQGGAAITDVASGDTTRRWTAHDFDAWCSAVLPGPSHPALLMTGGDDAKLKLWDARAEALDAPVASCTFDAGVVCITPATPCDPNVILVGSYDESVHARDLRMLRRDVAAVHVGGGGAWRVRPCGAAGEGTFVVAGMQGGAAFVRYADGDLNAIEVECGDDGFHGVARDSNGVAADEPLIYDVLALGDGRVATVSFYSNEIVLWRICN
jgi:hypothetical protein